MEFIVKMDLHEATKALEAGSLMALCNSIAELSMHPAEKPKAGSNGIDFAQKLQEKQAKDAAEEKARLEADAKKRAAAERKAAKAAEAAAAAEPEEETPEPGEEPELQETDEKTPWDDGAAQSYTLEDVRAALAKLNKAGKSAEVKKILASFGASKLTDVPKTSYPELMEKAAGL